MNTNDIPPCAIEVPVKIDDNGTKYKTIWYAGILQTLIEVDKSAIRPSVDWLMIDVTNSKDIKRGRWCWFIYFINKYKKSCKNSKKY